MSKRLSKYIASFEYFDKSLIVLPVTTGSISIASFAKVTARKTIFSEKMVFPKISRWNMIFLVLSENMIFLFPKNIILSFRSKSKDYISQKNTWKYDVFFKCSEKMVFPKNLRLKMIFFVISGKMVFLFSRKYVFFRRKMKEDDVYQKMHGNMIFPVYMYRRYKRGIALLFILENKAFLLKHPLVDVP